jgi:uncharacterized protein (DUF58 family)
MNRHLGWALALAAFVVGGWLYSWQGVVLAMTVVIFWLLLQFNQVLRVMRTASQGPIGVVPSAVMLQAKLKAGMKMGDVVMLTRSLGVEQIAAEQGETCYRWTDPGGHAVDVVIVEGRVRDWRFMRAEETA